jgi:hypothetical protein
VKYFPQPEYPEEALVKNIQGSLLLTACFGSDGKVISVGGNGGNPVLVKAAEENLRQWVFGSLPPAGEYPMCYTVEYAYKLEGTPVAEIAPSFVRVNLPERVEIVGHPFIQDDRPIELRPEPNQPHPAKRRK